VDVVLEEVHKRMPTLISSVMEAPSDTDELFTRSKHTPKKEGDVGNRPEILTPLVERLLNGRGDVLPSIMKRTRWEWFQLLYLEVRHDGFDMVYP
jgi:hypothetical protein